MNPQPELESESLRSEINTTRNRMDHTIDALGNRLEGRHLVDELLGFFRGRVGDVNRVRQKIGETAETAVHSVVDTVKAHPMPALLAGAGVAWLIYESTSGKRRSRSDRWAEEDGDERGYGTAESSDYSGGGYSSGYSGGEYAGVGGEASSSVSAGSFSDESGASTTQKAKEKLSEIGTQAREKLSQAADRGRETLQSAKQRVGEMTGQVQQRTREVYDRTRERVVTTADQHPLEVGLGCLAAGFLLALALPTPQVVHRRLGPTVDRLKDRTRAAGAEVVEKGKRVVQAAATAVEDEARNQGLTLEQLSAKAQGAQGAQGTNPTDDPSAQRPGGMETGGTAFNDPKSSSSTGPSDARSAI